MFIILRYFTDFNTLTATSTPWAMSSHSLSRPWGCKIWKIILNVSWQCVVANIIEMNKCASMACSRKACAFFVANTVSYACCTGWSKRELYLYTVQLHEYHAFGSCVMVVRMRIMPSTHRRRDATVKLCSEPWCQKTRMMHLSDRERISMICSAWHLVKW